MWEIFLEFFILRAVSLFGWTSVLKMFSTVVPLSLAQRSFPSLLVEYRCLHLCFLWSVDFYIPLKVVSFAQRRCSLDWRNMYYCQSCRKLVFRLLRKGRHFRNENYTRSVEEWCLSTQGQMRSHFFFTWKSCSWTAVAVLLGLLALHSGWQTGGAQEMRNCWSDGGVEGPFRKREAFPCPTSHAWVSCPGRCSLFLSMDTPRFIGRVFRWQETIIPSPSRGLPSLKQLQGEKSPFPPGRKAEGSWLGTLLSFIDSSRWGGVTMESEGSGEGGRKRVTKGFTCMYALPVSTDHRGVKAWGGVGIE